MSGRVGLPARPDMQSEKIAAKERWKQRWDSPIWITGNWLRAASYRDYQFDNLPNQ
jgi:hypothetical protein